MEAITAEHFTIEQVNELISAINLECDRLGWSELQRQMWLEENFGKCSRWLLTDHELTQSLNKLRTVSKSPAKRFR